LNAATKKRGGVKKKNKGVAQTPKGRDVNTKTSAKKERGNLTLKKRSSLQDTKRGFLRSSPENLVPEKERKILRFV